MPDESLVLDGLSLSSSGLVLEELDLTPPSKRMEWATGADSDGAALVRDPLFDNRTITAKVRVSQKSTMALAATAIAGISRKLEECEQQPDGLPLVWTPADGTVSALTFYCLSGSVTELPIAVEGESGYFVNAPVVTLVMTCKPFGYGTEVVLSAVSSSSPIVTVTVPSVPGDVPAEGRLVVTEGSSQNRRFVEWGLEQRYYQSGTSLLVDSDDMVTSGFAGAQTTRSGAIDANATGNNVIRSSLLSQAVGVCGLGALSHVGTFRVKARVYASSTSVRVRLSWQDGDGPFRPNGYQAPPVAGAYSELDLGVVTITPAVLGTQRWTGRIEAVGDGETIDVDECVLVPCREGYGRARGAVVSQAALPVGSDGFDGTVGTALNARTADLGGTWATSGAATDFIIGSNAHTLARNVFAIEASPRVALLGSSITGGVQASLRLILNGRSYLGVLARWVDASNYLWVRRSITTPAGAYVYAVEVVRVVAGTATTIASATDASGGGAIYLVAAIEADGTYRVTSNGAQILSGQDAALAAGGALASGKAGVAHQSLATSGGGASTQIADTFVSASLASSPPVVYAGRTVEFRSDGSAIRQDSAGVSYGNVPSYRGSRFLVPPAGDKGRTSRILVKADRNDLQVAADEPLNDSISVVCRYTPRYLVVNG